MSRSIEFEVSNGLLLSIAFIVILIVFAVILLVEQNQDNNLIEACITDGRSPVVEHGQLKECK